MQTKHTFETIADLNTVTGGASCARESMGYVNPPGTCEDQWSSAPNWGQNGFKGLDSAFKPLPPATLQRLNQGRAPADQVTPAQASATSKSILSSPGR
jgi:hypothetical protein